jgi:uncharacterized protein YbjT (DUF2867 family)
MSHVLVVGASRGIGYETVRLALDAGHQVRAMARSPAPAALRHSRLDWRQGDACDATGVAAALAGIDVVIQALGIRSGAALLIRPVRLFSEATRVLVPAMQAAGIRRLICLTGFGAGDSRNRGGLVYDTAFNLFLGRAYDDKDEQERIVRTSGLDWIIVRPGILTNGPLTGRCRVLVDPATWRCGFVSRADVADFMVRQIDRDDYLGRTPVLVG